MAQTTIWKPSTINSWKGGIAFLADAGGDRTPPVVTLPDGRQITGKFVNTNEGRHQWVFPKELAGMSDIKISYGGQTGTIANGATSYEGSGLSNWQARAKGTLGAGGGGAGVPGQFAPGSIGYGSVPAYLGDSFPSPFLVEYTPIERAPYEFTDPQEFAEKYSGFNRDEIRKNFDLGKDIALQELDLELEGLEGFVPVAANLKRRETALDNLFNIDERRRSVDASLPGVRGQLDAQGGRAEALAEGRLPDSIVDQGLSYGINSRATDQAVFAGTGAQSGAARNLASLMDADARFKISQAGESLLGQNIDRKASILMPPTAYSDAGSQVRVTPEVGAGRLAGQAMSEANSLTTIPTTAAFSGKVQQNQYETSLEQQTRMYNTTNQLNTDTFNATTQNDFALQKFNYDVGFAGAAAGAGQVDINTGVGLDQQQQDQDAFNEAKDDTQDANDVGAIAGGVGSAVGAAAGFLLDQEATPGMTSDALLDDLNSPESSALKTAGVSDTNDGTMRSIGNDSRGNELFVNPELADSTDTSIGTKLVNRFTQNLDDLGVVSERDRTRLEALGITAANPEFIASLDEMHSAGNEKAFGSELRKATGSTSKRSVSKLYDSWDRLSPAQKSTAIAAVGLEDYEDGGTKISKRNVVPATKNRPGMDVGQATKLAQKGVNVASLTKNYDQINDLQQIVGGERTPEGLADTARQYGMLGYGPKAVLVPSATPESLSRAGFQPAPQFGVGAAIGERNAAVPKGYTQMGVTKEGSPVIIPTGNMRTASGTQQPANQGTQIPGSSSAAGSMVAQQLATNPKARLAFALGPTGTQIYALWDKLPSSVQGVLAAAAAGPQGLANAALFAGLKGAAGGSAPARGMAALAAVNPSMFGSVMVTSLMGNVLGGKGKAQRGRDSVRAAIQNGLDSKDFTLGLADGTRVDYGKDGSARDTDIDTNSDLQFTAAMGGIALTRLLTGKKDTAVDQVGSQLGNAALTNIGRDKEYSRENYDKLNANMRAFYAQKGIKNKNDAYQLANQAFAEGRISESDLISMHQSYNMIFDSNSYDTARRLMSGRNAGAAVASNGSAASSTPAPASTLPSGQPMPRGGYNRNAVIARNRARYPQAA